jgi:hypothetical protein
MSEGGGYEAFYEGVRALVMGSVTYEWILDHLDVAGGEGRWPYPDKPCWVLSSRELRLPEGDRVDVRIVDTPVTELYRSTVVGSRKRPARPSAAVALIRNSARRCSRWRFRSTSPTCGPCSENAQHELRHGPCHDR